MLTKEREREKRLDGGRERGWDCCESGSACFREIVAKAQDEETWHKREVELCPDCYISFSLHLKLIAVTTHTEDVTEQGKGTPRSAEEEKEMPTPRFSHLCNHHTLERDTYTYYDI